MNIIQRQFSMYMIAIYWSGSILAILSQTQNSILPIYKKRSWQKASTMTSSLSSSILIIDPSHRKKRLLKDTVQILFSLICLLSIRPLSSKGWYITFSCSLQRNHTSTTPCTHAQVSRIRQIDWLIALDGCLLSNDSFPFLLTIDSF